MRWRKAQVPHSKFAELKEGEMLLLYEIIRIPFVLVLLILLIVLLPFKVPVLVESKFLIVVLIYIIFLSSVQVFSLKSI